MEILKGTTLSKGIAAGRICLYKKNRNGTAAEEPFSADLRLSRFFAAAEEADRQLKALYESSIDELGKKNAEIFEAQRLLIGDEGYLSCVKGLISGEGLSAKAAVIRAGEEYALRFEKLDDECIRARADDIRDVSERIVSILEGVKEAGKREIPKDAIVVAEGLLPSEAAALAAGGVAAVVLAGGTKVSHTAILMRAKHIPVLAGIRAEAVPEGQMAVLDGEKGTLILDPEREMLDKVKAMAAGYIYDAGYETVKRYVSESSGRIKLYANVNGAEDVSRAVDKGAEGIGLFRTEYLYLKGDKLPSEDEQFKEYEAAVRAAKGKKLVIRTADLGEDKLPAYMKDTGVRGIRRSLDEPGIFETQLRAILRASAYGDVSILLPMVTGCEEIREYRVHLENAMMELKNRKLEFNGGIRTGIMIETPAAALLSEELSGEADFFSIGTNDLTAYTLASDRQGSGDHPYCDHYHPAVLKLISMSAENARRAGITVSVCGEMAGEMRGAEILGNMGVDILSVNI